MGQVRLFEACPDADPRAAGPGRWVWIDGLPGYVGYERDGAVQTTALEIEEGRIVSIFITWNPDKLKIANGMGPLLTPEQ